jgi:xanthine dehydrogenase accessory factor
MSVEFLEKIAKLLREGKRVAVATVVETTGSTPRKAGARLAVVSDGTLLDSVGGGALEAMIVEDARRFLDEGGTGLKEYSLREGEHPGSTGMVCGGRARVHFQVEVPPERLIIFGGGHVGAALARLSTGLGFDVTVVEDRPRFLENVAFAGLVRLWQTGPDFAGDLPAIDPSTYVAVVTRCHRTDLAALRRVAGTPAAYLGLIGSRRKIGVVMHRLREEGVPEEALGRICAPIGMPIGACTPEEIAVSIAGEMIRVRRGFAPAGREVIAIPRPAERPRRRE